MTYSVDLSDYRKSAVTIELQALRASFEKLHSAVEDIKGLMNSPECAQMLFERRGDIDYAVSELTDINYLLQKGWNRS